MTSTTRYLVQDSQLYLPVISQVVANCVKIPKSPSFWLPWQPGSVWGKF